MAPLLGWLGVRFLMVFVAGIVFGLGRWISGSVWAAVLIHLVNNGYQAGL